jgi:predicted nucleic-acid-binding protein
VIGVDTNVLLRFVLRDDEQQFKRASEFFSQCTPDAPAFVPLLVVAETVWALTQRYGIERAQVRSLLHDMLNTQEMMFEEHAALAELVGSAERGDLADHIISFSARRAGCPKTVTFDRVAAKNVLGMELLA